MTTHCPQWAHENLVHYGPVTALCPLLTCLNFVYFFFFLLCCYAEYCVQGLSNLVTSCLHQHAVCKGHGFVYCYLFIYLLCCYANESCVQGLSSLVTSCLHQHARNCCRPCLCVTYRSSVPTVDPPLHHSSVSLSSDWPLLTL